jgi:hypothetical protein
MKQKTRVFYLIDVQEFHVSTVFSNLGTVLPKHVLEISGILCMSEFLSLMSEKNFSSGIRKLQNKALH